MFKGHPEDILSFKDDLRDIFWTSFEYACYVGLFCTYICKYDFTIDVQSRNPTRLIIFAVCYNSWTLIKALIKSKFAIHIPGISREINVKFILKFSKDIKKHVLNQTCLINNIAVLSFIYT